MATRTSTETKREITRKGDLVIVKEVETTTTYFPGKNPEVKEVTRVEEFKGEEGFKRLPEDVRRQLEGRKDDQKSVKPVNKDATRGNFAEDCLKEHNNFRRSHGAEPLTLSKQLMEESTRRAKELAERDQMVSRPDQVYGENLSCMWSSDPDHFVKAADVVSRWYSENKNYNFGEEPKDLSAGHFTQMVWRGCKEFGIAAAKSDSNKIYVVATYSPPGNYRGEFKTNVLPLGAKAPVAVPGANPSASPHVNPSASAHANPGASPHVNLSNYTRSGMVQPGKSVSVFEATEIPSLNNECVEVHNEYRKRHGVPPLKYSREVAVYAQSWANELARQDKFEHRKERKYGENLFCFKSSDPNALPTAAEACKSWYNEIVSYDFGSEPKSLATGHFTQMIWKTTTEVGMGRAKSKSGLHIIVANYNPPGNFVGTYRENVPRPIGK